MYHRLEDYRRKTGKNLKWLDYVSLLNSYATDEQTIERVLFFTAIDRKRDTAVIQRHENYLGALKAHSVEVFHGIFKYKDMTCKNCQYEWKKPEEKETDVRIAVKVLELVATNDYDECWVMTGDTDLVPLVQSFKVMYPDKKIVFLLPPVYNPELRHNNRSAAGAYATKLKIDTIQVGFKNFAEHALEDVIIDSKGRSFQNPYV